MMCACMSTIIAALLSNLAVWGNSGGAGSAPPDLQLFEHQNGTRDLARLHRAERFVDVAEPAATADHLVQHQAALAIELQVARNVRAKPVAAHARGLHLALRPDRHPRELDLRVRGHDTHDRGRAPDGEALDGLPDERGVTDRLEGVIDPRAARERAYRLDGIVLRSVEDVRGAHALGYL